MRPQLFIRYHSTQANVHETDGWENWRTKRSTYRVFRKREGIDLLSIFANSIVPFDLNLTVSNNKICAMTLFSYLMTPMQLEWGKEVHLKSFSLVDVFHVIFPLLISKQISVELSARIAFYSIGCSAETTSLI